MTEKRKTSKTKKRKVRAKAIGKWRERRNSRRMKKKKKKCERQKIKEKKKLKSTTISSLPWHGRIEKENSTIRVYIIIYIYLSIHSFYPHGTFVARWNKMNWNFTWGSCLKTIGSTTYIHAKIYIKEFSLTPQWIVV